MATIVIEQEEEAGSGWQFNATVRDSSVSNKPRVFRVRLAWVDYNLWSADGSDRPEAVARAALQFLLEREPAAELAESFDLARIRRRYPQADAAIPLLIQQ